MASKFPGSPEVKNPPSNAEIRAHPRLGKQDSPHSTGNSFCFCVGWEPEGTTSCRRDGVKDHVKKPRKEGEALSLHGLRLLHQPSPYLTLQFSWAPVTTSESTGKPLRGWVSLTELWANKKPLSKLLGFGGSSLCCETWKTNKQTRIWVWPSRRMVGSINQMWVAAS